MTTIVLNYYNCNKDSLWIALVIGFFMILFTIFLKIVVYNELYAMYDICSPFSLFVGNKKTCIKHIQNELVSKENASTTPATTTEDTKDTKETFVSSNDKYFTFQDGLIIFKEKWKIIKKAFHLFYLAITNNGMYILQSGETQIKKIKDGNQDIISNVFLFYVKPFLLKYLHPIL